MAIKKGSSRFSDRTKIRKMNSQGYSRDQIANALSITPDHVEYVLTKWDMDEETWRNREEARAKAEQDLKAQQNVLPAAAENAMRAQIEKEIMARLAAEALAAAPQPSPKQVDSSPTVSVTGEAAETDTAPDLDLDQIGIFDEELPPPVEEKPKRPRRKSA